MSAALLAPTDSPVLAEFMAALDGVNALADTAPGFVWRLKSDSGNATDILVSPDPLFLINMSVWESVETLFDFVYRSTHTKYMVRRREWFEKPVEQYLVSVVGAVGPRPDGRRGDGAARSSSRQRADGPRLYLSRKIPAARRRRRA